MRRVKLEIVGPIAMLICGIAEIIGLSQTWSNDVNSGWDGIRAGIANDAEPYVVLIGTIFMIVFSVAFLIILQSGRLSKAALMTCCIIASLAASFIMGGCLRFIIPFFISDTANNIESGVYVCLAAGTLGLIFGTMTSVRVYRALRIKGIVTLSKISEIDAMTLGLAVTLVCGMAICIGLPMTWISSSGWWALGSFSAWELLSSWLVARSSLILVGGILMIVCAIAIFVLPRTSKESEYKVRVVRIVAAHAALLVIFGAIWLVSQYPGSCVECTYYISHGFYFTVTAAILGLISSIATTLASYQHRRTIYDGKPSLKPKARVAEPLIVLACGMFVLVGKASIPQTYLVLVGGITIVILALIACAISVYIKESRRISIIIGTGTSMAALLSIAGISWFIISHPQILLWGPEFANGVYLSLAAAVLALVFGVMLSTNGWPKVLNKLYELKSKRRDRVSLS